MSKKLETIMNELIDDLLDKKPFPRNKAIDKLTILINEEKQDLLDKISINWNNTIGNMPDEEKQKLGYLELTGMLWGILGLIKIDIEDLSDYLKDRNEKNKS